jgi:hypothetical protein
MKTLQIRAFVDQNHQLHADVPVSLPPGPVDISIVLPPGSEQEASANWMQSIAREWRAVLQDNREDIYSYSDGEPIDGAR